VNEFLARLKQRKVVQWTIAYVAFAFALLQGVDVVAHQFDWPAAVGRGVTLALVVGFLIVLVVAWYHGERGVQKIGRMEVLIITALLAIGGAVLWRFDRVRAVHGKDVISGVSLAASAPVVIPSKSVAVLPFVNMSGDPKNDYFSDGVTEEILNALAQIPNLKVAARTSAFAFKGKEEDLRKIGEVLDVATVLEGSVQKAGDEVRITAQLIDTRSGYHLWSEKYDRKLTSIFAVEDEISKAIADKLQVQLTGAGESALVAQQAVDPRAHDAYLHGLTSLAARSLHDAATSFRQAVAIDPRYASALGALAVTDALMPAYFLEARGPAMARAETEANKALALDPKTSRAYVALAMVRRTRWQWADADAAFRRALAIAPGDAEAVSQYAQFLTAAGQFAAALRENGKALALNPLSAVVSQNRTDILLDRRRYDDAAAQARRTLSRHPDFALGYFRAMDAALATHRYADAERYARHGAQLAGEDPKAYAQMVRGIDDPSQRGSALRFVESASPGARWELSLQTRMKWLVRLGAGNVALRGLEDMVARREGGFEGVVWSPAFDPIRNDPRFKAALKKMGLPYRPDGSTPP
jgi:TolB-like protein/Tfp pilus assembly protein PilF